MIEYIYTKMKFMRREMIRTREYYDFIDVSVEQIIDDLRQRSNIYEYIVKEYGLLYDKEELLSVMCKAKYIYTILKLERSAVKLDDKRALMIIRDYLLDYKIKIVSLMLSGISTKRDFDVLKSSLLTTPEMNVFLERFYGDVHVYDLVMYLFRNKKLAKNVQNMISKDDLGGAMILLYKYRLDSLERIIITFKEDKFINLYVSSVLIDIDKKLNELDVEISMSNKMRELLYKTKKRISDEINKILLESAKKVFAHEVFSYASLLAYLILLEHEFKVMNLIAKSKRYENRLGKERIKEIVGEIL